MRGVVSCALISGGVLLLGGPPALGASLADQLDRFLQDNAGISAAEALDGRRHTFPDTAVPVIQRLVIRGIDFPVTSTSPGFTFRFNYELGTFEPTTSSLGPLFVDRADTLGAKRLEVGATYLFARLTEVKGDDLNSFSASDDLASVFDRNGSFTLRKNGAFRSFHGGLGLQESFGGRVRTSIFFLDEFALEEHVVNLSATYGLTDEWDVNLLVPIVGTRLIARGRRTFTTGSDGDPFGEPVAVTASSLDVDHQGVGDVQFRTKYQIGQAAWAKLASGLALRFPAGDEDNFQGTGDFTITPSLIASREFGRHDVHLSLGTEVNAGDISQTRARYALGVTLQPNRRAALLIDFIGNSSFVDDRFQFRSPIPIRKLQGVPGFEAYPGIAAPSKFPKGASTCTPTCTQFGFVPRTDILDLTMGFKFLLLPQRAVAHLGVIYPLNDDGLRAKVIPTGSVEVVF